MGPGIYKSTVLLTKLEVSSKETLGVLVRVAIDDGTQPEPEMIGHIWLSDKAYGMARQQLRAIGFDPDTEDLSGLDANPLAGNICQVEIGLENYQGQDSLKIKRFGGSQPPTPEALAKVQAGLRAAASKMRKPPAMPRNPNLPEGPPEDPDEFLRLPPEESEGIPF